MLAFTSSTNRKTRLEHLTRQALETGILRETVFQDIDPMRGQSDLTPDEVRILEILYDALHKGDVRRVKPGQWSQKHESSCP
jgi:hypothetical protein